MRSLNRLGRKQGVNRARRVTAANTVASIIAIVVAFSVIAGSSAQGADDRAIDKHISEILKASKKATTASELISWSDELLTMAEAAVDEDEYAPATRAVNLAVELLSKSRNKHLLMRAQSRKDEVQVLAREFKSLAKFSKKLESAPGDPEANRKTGLFHAVLKHAWQRAAGPIGKSRDALLSGIVAAELKQPQAATDQIHLATQWNSAAELETGLWRSRMQKRAYYWLQTAYRDASGDSRDRLDKVLAEMPFRYLSDMDEKDVGTGAWSFGKLGDNGSGGGARISVDNIAYSLGLGMHPDSGKPFVVKYKLNAQYKSFQGGCALNDTATGFSGELRFSIVGDGRVLWKSPPLKSRADTEFFTLNVKDVQTLELRTECSGNAVAGHAVWLDPFVAK